MQKVSNSYKLLFTNERDIVLHQLKKSLNSATSVDPDHVLHCYAIYSGISVKQIEPEHDKTHKMTLAPDSLRCALSGKLRTQGFVHVDSED